VLLILWEDMPVASAVASVLTSEIVRSAAT
jgi:hypothetical protein